MTVVHDMMARVARSLVLTTQAAGRVALQLTDRQRREMEVSLAHLSQTTRDTEASRSLCCVMLQVMQPQQQ